MNNQALTQALLRAARVFVVAGLVALGADASGIIEIGSGGDVLTGPLALAIANAVIEAILKAIGGATTPVVAQVGRGVGEGEKSPNILSV